MLYAFGSNGSGQLGVGHTQDLSIPQSVHSVGKDGVQQWSIRMIAAGGNHTVMLCSDGKLRASGDDSDGRCGFEAASQHTTFEEINHPRDSDGNVLGIVGLSATWSATLIACTDGNIYARGAGNNGELGIGHKATNAHHWQRIPTFSKQNSKVVSLCSSMAHTVAVMSDGSIYGWGKGRQGQLGNPAEDAWIPRRLDIAYEVERAVCGRDFTFVLGSRSSGLKGILGPQTRDRFRVAADIPASNPQWHDVAASWGTVFMLSANGHIVTWGRNDHGQRPTLGLPQVTAMAAGSEHCLALTPTNKVLAWGWGEHGNCGTNIDEKGDVKNRWNEIDISGEVVRIFAGCSTSFIAVVD